MIRQTSLAIVFILASSLTLADTQPANYGGNASKAENTGILSGITVGGLVGGPLGMIGGAAVGALLGDGWNAKHRVNDLQVSLYEAQLQLAMLQDQSRKREQELAQAQERSSDPASRPDAGTVRIIPAALESPITRICCDNTVVSLHFRTGSSAVETPDEEILSSFANLSRQLPEPTIEIIGYADRNGDADANLTLSRRRSEAVKNHLADLGIKNSTITTIAYGESKPAQATQSLEADFFDRRVVLRLRDASQLLITQSNNGQ